MRYRYTAYGADNKMVEGEIEANRADDVLKFLGEKGLKPVSVKPAALPSYKSGSIFGGKISLADKVFLTRYLSLMLRVGTDLFQAIDILIADFEKPAVKSFLKEIKRSLEKGEPFYSTFARYPRNFSETFVNLVKAGESSGTLDKVLDDLTVALEKERALKSQVRGALIYPIILIVLAVLILTFLVSFALPRIAEVFSGGGFNPPLFSKIVFAVGLFLEKYIWLFWGLGIVGLVFFGFFFAKTLAGKRALSKIVNFIPFVKPVINKLALQRFASTLSSLLKSGMPIVNAIEITANAVGYESIKVALKRIAREGIAKGLTLGESFKREKVFPNVVANLVAISEKAGHLDEVLKTLSEFYEVEIERSLKTLVAIMEPLLLIFIGGIVAIIALAIIVPIYQLVGQF